MITAEEANAKTIEMWERSGWIIELENKVELAVIESLVNHKTHAQVRIPPEKRRCLLKILEYAGYTIAFQQNFIDLGEDFLVEFRW